MKFTNYTPIKMMVAAVAVNFGMALGAGPNSIECRNDQKLLATLNAKYEELQGQRAFPENQGPGSWQYTQNLQQLSNRITATGKKEQADCAEGAWQGEVTATIMSPLEQNTNRNGMDFGPAGTEMGNASECATTCLTTAGCASMTFVQHPTGAGGICWLKIGVPVKTAVIGMISSYRTSVVVTPSMRVLWRSTKTAMGATLLPSTQPMLLAAAEPARTILLVWR